MTKCQNPECEYMACGDPDISMDFCCEKCEGRFHGQEWASQGKKKHTAFCTCNAGKQAEAMEQQQLEQCKNPECEYPANPDPQISPGFCCEKCQGRFNGEEWAMGGKKKHTACCTSKVSDFSYLSEDGAAWNPGGPRKCAHPECNYRVNSDPGISTRYCCEKCEGLHSGADWAQGGGKRHYRNCEQIEMPWGPGSGGGGWGGGWMDGMCGKGKGGKLGWGDAGMSAYDPYQAGLMWMMSMWGKGPPMKANGMCKGKGKGGGAGGGDGGGGCKGGKGGKGGKDDGGLNQYAPENKILVGDLPTNCTVEDLKAHFGLAGSVACAVVMKPGTAGVAFEDPAEAEAAVMHLSGTEIHDKPIKVTAWAKK